LRIPFTHYALRSTPMHHAFIDRFSDLDSPVHRLDPRAKIVCILALTVLVVSAPKDRFLDLVVYAVPVAVLLALSRLPLGYLFKRCLLVAPFVATIAIFFPFTEPGRTLWSLKLGSVNVRVTLEGLLVCGNLLLKFMLTVLAVLVLSSTTKFADLLKGLEMLKAPRMLVTQLAFLYRYLFLLLDQGMKMKRARDARGFGATGSLGVKATGGLVGVLFMRSYDRAERIYAAMASRGFDGHVRTLSHLRFSRADVAFTVAFLGYAFAVWALFGLIGDG